eukprot:SAG31_NODE_20_length_34168_cov_33.651296_30_plen_76_part_00
MPHDLIPAEEMEEMAALQMAFQHLKAADTFEGANKVSTNMPTSAAVVVLGCVFLARTRQSCVQLLATGSAHAALL